MTIRLRAKMESCGAIDFRGVPWDRLRGEDAVVVAKHQVHINRIPCKLGDLFEIDVLDVSAMANHPVDFHLVGDFKETFGIASSNSESTLVVSGDVGSFVAQGMCGGRLIIDGSAGDHLGQGMKQGLIYVTGNCGDDLASPGIGQRSGMKDGTIIVRGRAGDRVAARMRRGTIVISGDSGDDGCSNMFAGTIIALGKIGARWAERMRRGTLVIPDVQDIGSGSEFSPAKSVELTFLPLLWRHWRKSELEIALLCQSVGIDLHPQSHIPGTMNVNRRVGDLSVKGRGEVLGLLLD